MKKLVLLLSLFVFGTFYSCNEDEKVKTETENTTNTIKTLSVNDSIRQAYKVVYENMVLNVTLEKTDHEYKNTFVFKDTVDGQEFLNLDYSFNNEKEGWKYDEQTKAIAFANELKDLNIGKPLLEKLNIMLKEGYGELFYEVHENNYNQELFSIFAYLDSAVSANLRMINEEKTFIEGTISPSFLIGKSFFIFQEDFVVDLVHLRNNIDLLETEAANTGWQKDIDMVNFIKNSTQNNVTFDTLYSFYISKEDFKQHINDKIIFKKGDCSEKCVIGCGSDWGCCMNYTGCCYYSSVFCLWHDLKCTNCEYLYCGPGCKPDGPEGNRPVKVFMALL
ncbi:MAG: hypothetical protein KIG55_02120 [Myroides sp.]|nr:hypothetical protein [uncultured Flavobacterium sp.]MBS7320375.1 hypothetical protein [Myroides sp.]